MSFMIYCALVTFIPFITSEEQLQCQPWTSIEEKLRTTALQVNCTHTTTCTGISCFLEKYGYEVHSGIHLNPCENPSSLEFMMDIPKLNINQWKRKFYHGDTFSINDNLGGKFEIQKEKDSFILSLTMHIHSNSPSSPLLHLIPTILPNVQYPVFHNVVFPMPSCSKHSDSVYTVISTTDTVESISMTSLPPVHSLLASSLEYSNCSIRNSSCPEHELCQQIDKSRPAGTCICVKDYVRDKNGKCVYNPASGTTTEVPGGHTIPDHGSSSNTSLLLTAILVPITVILLIVGLVYGSIRFRICQHLRRRLRVQVYEHVLLGQDDDDDIEDDSSNPVA